MERKTLKFLRLLIPGLILIFEFLPLFKEFDIGYRIGEGWLGYSMLVIPAIVIGAIYHIIDVRFFITNYSHRKIDLNITDSLLKIYNKEITQEQLNILKQKKFKHIFYHLIDNDLSLTAKSQLVYFNGLLWTSTADVFLLSIFSSIVYFAIGIFLQIPSIWMIGIFIMGIGLISIMFHIITVFKHFNLSNDQLEFIETHYRDKLRNKIDEILQ